MSRLTHGFDASEQGAGVRAFAAEYAEYAFVGRDDELDALDRWLQGDVPTMLVIAPAGWGKSALLHRWADRTDGAVWVPVSQRFQTSRSAAVRALLSARLSALGHRTHGDWVDQLAAAETGVVVVIDGLDEAVDPDLEDDIRALNGAPHVRLVVGARRLPNLDAAQWSKNLGWTGATLELDRLARAAVDELLPDVEPERVDEVARIAAGETLSLVMLADLARRADPLQLEEAPSGLEGVFDVWWTTQNRQPPTDYDAVVAALCRATGPVPVRLLARASGVPVARTRKVLAAIAGFAVRTDHDVVSFVHPRLAYYFSDRLTAEQRADCDAAWADQTSHAFHALCAGGPTGEETAYVLASHAVHLRRADAGLPRILELLDARWLDVWERVQGSAGGFMADLLGVWAAVEATIAGEWSIELSALQMKLSAISTFVVDSEVHLSPRARAEAVRLGVRSQRAAIASVASIVEPAAHSDAVLALIDALDDRGFDRLLEHSPAELGWPAAPIARRLVRRGRFSDALDWALRPAGRAGDLSVRATSLFPLFVDEAARDKLRQAVRDDLERFDPHRIEVWIANVTAAATIFDGAERVSMLWRAKARLDDADVSSLDFDPSYDEKDPRLVLAVALAAAGQADAAAELLDGARTNPYPWSDKDLPLGSEFVLACARCRTPIPLTEIPPQALLEAELELEARGESAGLVDREFLVRRLAASPGDRPAAFRHALSHSDPAVGRAAAQRLAELVVQSGASPDDYALAHGLYAGGLQAFGEAVRRLTAVERDTCLDVVWGFADSPPPPMTWWHVLHALIPLLRASHGARRDEIASALFESAKANLHLSPPLCDVPDWSDVYTLDEQREYVGDLVRQRTLTDARRHVRTLLDLADDTPPVSRGRVLTAASALAISEGTLDELVGVAKRAPERWPDIADRLLTSFPAVVGPWTLSKLVACAPSAEQSGEVARRVWRDHFDVVAGLACATDFLRALPSDEAERLAERLIRTDAMRFINFRDLPPMGLVAAFELELATPAATKMIARAMAVARARDVKFHPRVAVELDTTISFVINGVLTAPDESNEYTPHHEVWTVLGLIMGCLESSELDRIEQAAHARGPTSIVAGLNWRREQLGQPERVTWGRRAGISAVERLRASLRVANTGDDLAAAIATLPKAKTYTWVAQLAIERGLAYQFASLAVETADPTERLLMWDAVWDDLGDHARIEFWPHVYRALEVEPSRIRFGWVPWLKRMPESMVRVSWCNRMRQQRLRAGYQILHAYSRPLNASEPHADALIDALSWFVPAVR